MNKSPASALKTAILRGIADEHLDVTLENILAGDLKSLAIDPVGGGDAADALLAIWNELEPSDRKELANSMAKLVGKYVYADLDSTNKSRLAEMVMIIARVSSSLRMKRTTLAIMDLLNQLSGAAEDPATSQKFLKIRHVIERSVDKKVQSPQFTAFSTPLTPMWISQQGHQPDYKSDLLTEISNRSHKDIDDVKLILSMAFSTASNHIKQYPLEKCEIGFEHFGKLEYEPVQGKPMSSRWKFKPSLA